MTTTTRDIQFDYPNVEPAPIGNPTYQSGTIPKWDSDGDGQLTDALFDAVFEYNITVDVTNTSAERQLCSVALHPTTIIDLRGLGERRVFSGATGAAWKRYTNYFDAGESRRVTLAIPEFRVVGPLGVTDQDRPLSAWEGAGEEFDIRVAMHAIVGAWRLEKQIVSATASARVSVDYTHDDPVDGAVVDQRAEMISIVNSLPDVNQDGRIDINDLIELLLMMADDVS